MIEVHQLQRGALHLRSELAAVCVTGSPFMSGLPLQSLRVRWIKMSSAIRAVIVFLVSLLITAALLGSEPTQTATHDIPYASARATGMELFRDVAFANGFGVGGWSKVDMAPLKAIPIPDDAKLKAWEFGEGAHQNFADADGRYVKALYEHLLVVNHMIEVDRRDCLKFAQYNNHGLAASDAGFNKRLVKRVETNRNGTIRLHYNTKNEIRNVATAYSPEYANDLWPHLLLWQHFAETPRVAQYSRLNLKMTVTVLAQTELSDWLPGREMNLMFYFLLVDEKSEQPRTLWVGMMIHSSNERLYREHIGREQYGDVFYRDSITNYGPPLKHHEPRKICVDLKELIRKAVGRFDEVHAELSRDPDAYTLRDFNFGFEGLGHWESEVVLSDLSLLASPVIANDGNESH